MYIVFVQCLFWSLKKKWSARFASRFKQIGALSRRFTLAPTLVKRFPPMRSWTKQSEDRDNQGQEFRTTCNQMKG